MKYVGATDTFIKGPFMIEGIMIGIISTVITTVILTAAYEIAVIELVTQFQKTISVSGSITSLQVVPIITVLPQIVGTFLFLSVLLGVIASSRSMKKYLDV